MCSYVYYDMCSSAVILNSAQVRTSITASECLTLVASYEGERDDVGFTLTAYSNAKLAWAHTPMNPPYTKDVRVAYSVRLLTLNAAEHRSEAHSLTNPQAAIIRIRRTTSILSTSFASTHEQHTVTYEILKQTCRYLSVAIGRSP